MSNPLSNSNDPLQKTPFELRLAWIKKLALIAAVTGAVIGIIASICAALYMERFPIRGVLMMPFIISGIFGSAVVGPALLFAPSSFFTSDEGRKYLALIGTQNVLVARIAIVLGLLIVYAVISVLGYTSLLLFGMTPEGR